MRQTWSAVALVSAIALAGCGSGAASNTPAPTRMVIMLGSQGAVPAHSIGAVEVTVTLPAGVAPAAGANGKLDLSTLTASGVAASGSTVTAGHYTAATSSASGKAKVVVVKTAGFDAGEFARLTCSIASGASPAAGDASVTSFKAFDRNGVAITGLTPTIVVETR